MADDGVGDTEDRAVAFVDGDERVADAALPKVELVETEPDDG